MVGSQINQQWLLGIKVFDEQPHCSARDFPPRPRLRWFNNNFSYTHLSILYRLYLNNGAEKKSINYLWTFIPKN